MAIVPGTVGDDNLYGTSASDQITGLGGDDTIFDGDSGAGAADTISGGDGDDTVYSYGGADSINGGSGQDVLNFYFFNSMTAFTVTTNTVPGGTTTTSNGTQFSNFERLYFYLGSGDDVVTGGDGDDSCSGNAGNDTFNGGSGRDNGYGGQGNDLLTGGSGGDYLGGDDGNDTLHGNSGSDSLYGGAGIDSLFGGDGYDYMEGGAGGDALDGGAGIDTLTYYNSTAAVTVNLVSGTSGGGDAQGDSFANFENVTGSQRNDTLTGNAGTNSLSGNAGNDVLSGGGEYDSLYGDAGNDTLSGDAGNDYLSAGDGDDVLRGGAGADSFYGDNGNDTASYFTSSVGVVVSLATGAGSGGDAQNDFLNGIENLSGSQGSDSLVGSTVANTLQGWNGNDVLTGAGGRDTLTGGVGADRFVYGSIAQSPVGAGADLITDFRHAQGDRIDLSAIDANTTVAGSQAFTFIGTGLYTGVAGQLRYAKTSVDTTIVAGDLNGNGTSDFHIVLSGHVTLVAGDFVL